MLLLQETQMVATMAADTLNAMAPVVEEPAKLNFFEMCLKGGWIMIPLALMLIFAIYIFIERLIVTRQASKEDATFMNRIKDYIYDGKLDAALKLCRDTQSPSARMIEKGISRLGRPMSDVLVAIENVGNIEIAKLEKMGEKHADAVNYHVVGCYECGGEGELTCSCNARVNIPLALELALWGTAPSAVKDMKWCDVPPENKLLQAWNLLKSLDCIDDAGHLKAYGKKL